MLKRPFVCVAITFVIGILAFIYRVNVSVLLIAVLAFSVITFFRKEKYKYLLLTLAVVLLLGFLRMQASEYQRVKILEKFNGKEMTITATVTEFSCDGKAIAEFRDGGKTRKILLFTENKQDLFPGDIIRTTVDISEPFSSKVSVSDYSTYLASKNIYIQGFASDAEIVGRQKNGIKGAVYTVRRYVDSVGKKGFSGNARALFNAMILGDKRLMSDELQESLRAAGLNHIAVVSGMHLSVVMTLLILLFGNIIGNGRRGKVAVSLGAVAVTFITGAGASVVRACIMCIVCQGAFLTRRENDPLSALFLTVFVMTAINPFMLFNIGFILSVLSVLGILLYSKPVGEKVLKIIGGNIGEAVTVCISAQLMVVPAVICFFATVSPYSILSNVMVTVFASLIVICGMIFTIVAKIPIISGIMAFLTVRCCNAVTTVCEFIQNLPGALTEVHDIKSDFFIIWIFLLVLFFVRKKSKRFIMNLSLCFMSALVVMYIISVWSNNRIKMDFVSYGKHTMTAVEYPDGPAVLLGCPDSNDAVVLAESHKRTSYTYTVIAQNTPLEEIKLAESGAAGTVIANGDMLEPWEKEELTTAMRELGTELILLDGNEVFSDGDFSAQFRLFDLGENVVPAVFIEYKGKSLVSLQEFDGYALEKLKDKNIFFQCDLMKLSPNLPNSENEYDMLTTGEILTDEKSLSVKLY